MQLLLRTVSEERHKKMQKKIDRRRSRGERVSAQNRTRDRHEHAIDPNREEIATVVKAVAPVIPSERARVPPTNNDRVLNNAAEVQPSCVKWPPREGPYRRAG